MMTEQHKQQCPTPNGKLMIIGGAEQKEDAENKTGLRDANLEIHEQFLKLIDKPCPTILVITSASVEDVDESFKSYMKTFKRFISCNVVHAHHNK